MRNKELPATTGQGRKPSTSQQAKAHEGNRQMTNTFATAAEAIARLLAFESERTFNSAADEFYQYEVSAVFDCDRKVIGYQVRVKDIDGFGKFSLHTAS